MTKILIAVDGSTLALDAVHHVLALVRDGLRADVVLANVQEPASLYELVTSRDPDLIAKASIAAGNDLMASARALLNAAGVSHTAEIGIGTPSQTLANLIESTQCTMAVIGARGQGGFSGAVLGSTSQRLAHYSPVPLTIVRHAATEVEPGDLREDDTTGELLEDFRGE